MEKDEGIEAATSSNPNFKSSTITNDQRAKFQELQQRRLKMQTKIKNKTKFKGSSKFRYSEDKIPVDDYTEESLKDSSAEHCSEGKECSDVSLSTSHADMHPALKKKKLHWGLDTKARWERKANM